MGEPSLRSRERSPDAAASAPGASRALPAAKAWTADGALTGHVARFGVAGAATVGVDLSVYAGLLSLGAPLAAAKAVAFACGATFAYWANKNWTFRAGRGSARQFALVAILYGASMAVNVSCNSAIVALVGDGLKGKAIAYCLALGLSAALNFIGLRAILLNGAAANSAGGE